MGRRYAAVARYLLVAAAATLSGCDRLDYRGDGTLSRKKAPAWFCQDEHDVALGNIDLSRPGQTRRILEGLPPGEYVVGFYVRLRESPSGPDERVIDMRSPDPFVILSVVNERGERVFSASSRLADWVRSGPVLARDAAFLYKRGVSRDVRVSPSTTQSRREGIGADEGWGSYFTARRNGRYTIVLDVDKPDPEATKFDAELEVRGVVGCL